ncbi:fibronectin type III domain-containing protein [Myroides pelagicus]|uniref:Fibronectin type-III domain-containing protein n=1 Tax=Myroides pelagicus TaxID=270914 RepID=A0A7K1GQW6_9FLAO|nr:hypothetical protein [Myroides pelagicus]MTH30879.1 hypothetical protein [Myroides pelagicus]
MKRQTRKVVLGMLASLTMVAISSCSSDDNTIEEKPIVKPAEKATVELAVKDVTETSVTFSVNATNATNVSYYLIKADQNGDAPVITQEEIFSKGTALTSWEAPIEVTDLEDQTKYYIFAAAKNKDGVITLIEQPISATTLQKIDVSIQLSDIDSTHERVIFTITPDGAKTIRYKVVEKTTPELTVDQVLEQGSNIMNVKAPVTLKPKGFKPETEYTIYVAAVSLTGAKLLKTAQAKTKSADDATDDGTIVFTNVEFTSSLEEKAGQKLAYYTLHFKNTKWQARFQLGALSSNADEIKEGKYILSSKRDPGNPGPERIADNFEVIDLQTNQVVKDIDYGDIIVTKENGSYKIAIDMVKLDIKNPRFKGVFQGNPVKK